MIEETKRGDEITTKEIRKKLKVSVDEFASLLGISRRSLYYKEDGTNPWTLDEIITITEIMKQNGIEEHLTVSSNGIQYSVTINIA